MFDNMVTRYPDGITNLPESDVFSDLKMSDPTLYHSYLNDFDTYVAADWVVTETDAGTTQALTAGDGGWLLLTNTAADNDLVALQKTPAAFSFTAGKRAFFKTRFKVSDATQSDIAVGLQVVDTTPLDVSDGVYFLKTDGAATLDFIVRKNATTGSTSATAIATMANDTFVTLAWYYDGVDRIVYAVNGTVLGTLSGTSAYLPDTICTVSAALQNGEAVAKTMTIDLIAALVER